VSYDPYAATCPRQSENRLPQGENYQAGHILSIKNDLVDRSKKKEPQGNCSSFARRFHPETKLDGRPINITVHGLPVGAISDIGTKKKGCRRRIGRARPESYKKIGTTATTKDGGPHSRLQLDRGRVRPVVCVQYRSSNCAASVR
jgi:hypothetical protein